MIEEFSIHLKVAPNIQKEKFHPYTVYRMPCEDLPIGKNWFLSGRRRANGYNLTRHCIIVKCANNIFIKYFFDLTNFQMQKNGNS